jgi:hypothetical protein
MLAAGTMQIEVVRWMNEQKPALKISGRNMSIHNGGHRLPAKKEFTWPEGGDKKPGATQNKPLDPPTEETRRRAKELADAGLCLPVGEFLDLIINRCTVEIVNGNLKPTVAEAVKAAEIKTKTKDENEKERLLLELFGGMVTKRGYLRQN